MNERPPMRITFTVPRNLQHAVEDTTREGLRVAHGIAEAREHFEKGRQALTDLARLARDLFHGK